MSISMNYTSPTGQSISFSEGSPTKGQLLLRNYSGLDSNILSPSTQKSPFQIGQSLIGANIEARVISVTLLIYGHSNATMRSMMQTLVNALYTAPAAPGQVQQMGVLTITVGGVSYKIDCIPQNSPQFVDIQGEALMGADIEFYCPHPYFQSTTVKTSAVTNAGTNLTVNNGGNVPIPCLIKVNGPSTDPIVTNVTTGERISFTHNLLTGHTLNIDTTFGNKTVIRTVSGSANTFNMLSQVKFAESTFFLLRPGNNTIRLTTPHGNFGTVQVISQDAYSGIGV